MSLPVQRGRVDLLILALAESAFKQHVQPQLTIADSWERGVGALAQSFVVRALPAHPINGVRLGQLQIPLGVLEYFGECVGIIPKRIGGPGQ